MDSHNPGQSADPTSAPDGGAQSTALEAILSGLNWAYDRAVDGLPGTDSVEELVGSYLDEGMDPEEAIDDLIRWQIGKAGTAGFISNLGGVITLPIAIPANLAMVLFIQLRMIADIAMLRGYDVRSDQVKTLCVACLAGSAVTDILRNVGVQVGAKLTQQAIMQIAGTTLVRINQAVGFRLVTKAGATGVVNLTKMVPFLGGFVGGTIDGLTTNAIGWAAKGVFKKKHPRIAC